MQHIEGKSHKTEKIVDERGMIMHMLKRTDENIHRIR